MPDNALYYRLAYAATLLLYSGYALSLVLRRQPRRSRLLDPAPVLSTGAWFLTLLVSSIPVVNLVMLVIWTLDASENPNRSNFAKASLVLLPVFVVLNLFLFLAIAGEGASLSLSLSGAGR